MLKGYIYVDGEEEFEFKIEIIFSCVIFNIIAFGLFTDGSLLILIGIVILGSEGLYWVI